MASRLTDSQVLQTKSLSIRRYSYLDHTGSDSEVHVHGRICVMLFSHPQRTFPHSILYGTEDLPPSRTL